MAPGAINPQAPSARLVVTVRKARHADIPVMRRVEADAASIFAPSDLPPALAQPMAAAELARLIDGGLVWVAQDARGAALGFVACETVGRALHVVEMDVDPNAGRRGIGTTLLQQAIAQAEGADAIEVITLTTFDHLPWNAPFYGRHGFRRLVADGGFEHLRAALANESAHGLKDRVAMARKAA
ncbi:GNAT family N-acetyltransferase [Rubrivivax gelatinosus]|uniref:Putative N-acetyltransferase n=1 Tax=Rubrivivax gelatinosus (strain NBRC 100245 / IL144) TaxID=983917 RepID=I0HQG3_RUBGI|nr:GNAT family N-acetyltransferase [Rubrivivax gelatinosus]BAL95250.1 putative N-acetyltransferase [Rubrivivax gelatinosus IL144]